MVKTSFKSRWLTELRVIIVIIMVTILIAVNT